MFGKKLFSKFVEATPDEVDKLNQQGINTINDLWARLEKTSIEQLAVNTEIKVERLLLILTKENDCQLPHWFDMTALAISIIVLVVIPLRIARNLIPLPHIPWLQHSVVVSTTKIPAFHVINKTDVQTKFTFEPNTFAKPDDVVGRYTFESISQASVLRRDQVSAVQLSSADIVNRQILSLPIDSTALATVVTPGSHVSLLFSPNNQTQAKLSPYTLNDVIILSIVRRPENASLVIAVKNNSSFEEIKPLLGISKVFILQKWS